MAELTSNNDGDKVPKQFDRFNDDVKEARQAFEKEWIHPGYTRSGQIKFEL